MRIGILGGSFNPIHRGHLFVAEQTRLRLPLDHVIFIPTGDPPHKPGHLLAPAHHRLQMVHLAVKGIPYFSVSDIEARSPEKSYTIDTLSALQRTRAPDTRFFFIVGLDAFLDIPTWKNAPQLLATANFVVVSRPGSRFTDLQKLPLLSSASGHSLEELDTGKLERHEIPTSATTAVILLPFPPCAISASAIRHRLQHGEQLPDWLPPLVESYILQHHLYHSEE